MPCFGLLPVSTMFSFMLIHHLNPILSGRGRGKPCPACAIIIDCEKQRHGEIVTSYNMTSSNSLQQLFHAREDSQQFLAVYDAMYKPPPTPAPTTQSAPNAGVIRPSCKYLDPNRESSSDDDDIATGFVVENEAMPGLLSESDSDDDAGFVPAFHDDPDMPALNEDGGESDSDTDDPAGFCPAADPDLSAYDPTVPVDPSAFDPDVPVMYDSDDDLDLEDFTALEDMQQELLAAMDTDAMYLSMSDGIEHSEPQPNSSKMNLHTCKHCGAWLYRYIVRGKMNVETCFCGSKGSVALELRRSFPLKPLPPTVLPLYTSGDLAKDSSKFNGLLGMTGLTLPSDPSIKGQNHPRFNAGFKIKGTVQPPTNHLLPPTIPAAPVTFYTFHLLQLYPLPVICYPSLHSTLPTLSPTSYLQLCTSNYL